MQLPSNRSGFGFAISRSLMDERIRRQWAASEAAAYGWGGIKAVSRATGMSPTTIRRGSAEMRIRRACADPMRCPVAFVGPAAVVSDGGMLIGVS